MRTETMPRKPSRRRRRVPLPAHLARSIGVGPREDPENGDALTLLVDSIEDAVRSSPSAVAILQGGTKAPAYSMWVVEEASNDEFERSKRHCLGEFIRQLTAS